MKKFVFPSFLFLFLLNLLNSCYKGAPTCSITSPTNGQEIIQGESVTIKVNVEGSISEVRFYINDTVVGYSSTIPYEYDWNTTGVATDTHAITAIVEDKNGFRVYDKIGVIVAVTVTDFDGNKYRGQQIGEQIWLTENLKTSHYADGTPIPLVQSSSDWENLGNGAKAYCYFDNSLSNLNSFGAFYTWAAAMNGQAGSEDNPSGVQGVCPNGWHLPSMAEWIELINYLNDNHSGLSGSDFSAIVTGYRNSLGTYYGTYSYFWCSEDKYPNTAWHLGLFRTEFDDGVKNSGFCVRCIKDQDNQ